MEQYNFFLTICVMIEVKARLLRGSVFFAGECIECEIIFTNTASVAANTCNQTCNHSSSSEYRKEENETDRLAWASAQIHCQCSVNESRVKLPSRIDRTSNQLSTRLERFLYKLRSFKRLGTNSSLECFLTGFCWYAIRIETNGA